MAKSRILGPDGEPIELGRLDQEIAAGGLTGVRQTWVETIARGLTPARLTSILERAAQNDGDDFLTLAEEMEERDPHYASVLSTRKRAVSSLPVAVEAVSESADDVRNAAFIEALTQEAQFSHLVEDLLDGLGKGYSVVELIWNRGAEWTPRAYEHRDPRWFQWDRETGRELRLRDALDVVNGLPLPAFKFIVHRPRIKSGLQMRAGLARLVAFCWICKAYAMKDWLAFAEVFGMPLRLGHYGPNANADDVAVLKRAVAAIGSDAAAVLPESMKIEFINGPQVGGGTDLFGRLADWLDRQVSKAVLGQTNTTDAQSGGLGSGQADVHNDVRGDIQAADARDLAATLNRDLVRPAIDLNFGPQKKYPRISFQIAEPEDLQGLATALGTLVPLGLEVEQSVIRDKFGIPEPAKGAKLLSAPQPPAAPSMDPQPGENPALNRTRLALNRSERGDARDAVDELVDEALQDWTEQLDAIIDPIEQLAADATDAEDFLRRLPALASTVEPTQLLRSLALAAFKARGLGDGTDRV